MQSIRMSADDLYREEVLEARAMAPDRKLVLGLELFERVRASMIAGIRLDHPEADDETVQRLLKERIELAERLEKLP